MSGQDDGWNIPTRLINLSTLPVGIMSPQLSVFPAIMIICKGCGYTRLFSLVAMGIEPAPRGGTNG